MQTQPVEVYVIAIVLHIFSTKSLAILMGKNQAKTSKELLWNALLGSPQNAPSVLLPEHICLHLREGTPVELSVSSPRRTPRTCSGLR